MNTLLRQSAWLYALFLIPTVLWLLYGGRGEAALSRSIGDTWQAGFWHLPGLSENATRMVLDGLEWLAIAASGWIFIQGMCLRSDETNDARLALRWTALCGLILLAVIPFHSSDMYGYINRGVQQSLYHTNPYAVTVSQIPGWQREPMFHDHWVYNPCPYGFFFAGLAKGLAMLAGHHFIAAFLLFKLLNVLALLGTTWLVGALAQLLGHARPWRCAWLFGANPLVLLHSIGNGHNDILMVFLLLLAFWVLGQKTRAWLALPLLALSVLTKYATVLAGPFMLLYLLKNRQFKPLGMGFLAALALILLLAAPYINQPWALSAMLDNAGKDQHSIIDMLADLIRYPARLFLHAQQARAIKDALLSGLKPLFLLVFTGFYGWQLVRFSRGEATLVRLIAAITRSLVALVVIASAKFHPWYVVMFLPAALVLPEGSRLRRFALMFSIFQLAGFTLLQNLPVFSVLLLTVLPLWMALKSPPAPAEA